MDGTSVENQIVSTIWNQRYSPRDKLNQKLTRKESINYGWKNKLIIWFHSQQWYRQSQIGSH